MRQKADAHCALQQTTLWAISGIMHCNKCRRTPPLSARDLDFGSLRNEFVDAVISSPLSLTPKFYFPETENHGCGDAVRIRINARRRRSRCTFSPLDTRAAAKRRVEKHRGGQWCLRLRERDLLDRLRVA